MALYRIEHLTFEYPSSSESVSRLPALRDVSLEIEPGSFTVLAGASGCGKTTLLRLMKSALAPHGTCEGSVWFDGRLLNGVPHREQAARIGFVIQIPEAQLVSHTVWHELAFGLENLGVPPDEMRLRVAEMASFFGIEPWFRRSVDELSGGQKQLLNLAAVMALHPDVLLLDEPTAQLDPIAASDFLGAVAKVNRELGCTVVMAEHRLDEVFPLADNVVVLDRGAVTAQGDPRAVGCELWEQGSALAPSLPSPLRICLEVDEGRTDAAERVGGCEGLSGSESAFPAMCDRGIPLTVREGRRWLAECIGPADSSGGGPLISPKVETGHAQPALEVDDLWLRYTREGSDVLHGASLTVSEGQLYALMGGNGAGKSTLLRVVCGAARPYRGCVRLFGQTLKSGVTKGRQGLAMLPQDPRSLFAHATVRAELEEMKAVWELGGGRSAAFSLLSVAKGAAITPSDSVGSGKADNWEDVLRTVVGECSIAGLLDAHPFDLSGGEQQRVALAKVLLAQPRVLLLDEPTKSLDGGFKEELAQLLHRLTERGATVLMVSHDVEFCARHADRVGLLFDGELVSEGAPRQFFAANSFYTTAANRMSRGIIDGAVTDEEVIAACLAARGE